MKIGFVFDDSLDAPDGVQQYLLTLGRWLTENGHDVHYLVGETARDDIPGVHSLSRNIRVKYNRNWVRIPLPAGSKRIKALLDEEQFDVLHVAAPFSPMLAAKVINSAPQGTRIVSTFLIAPASKAVETATKGLAALTRRAVGRIDKHISLSSVARDFAYGAYGVESEIIPSPIDVKMFRGADRSDAAAKAKAEADNETKQILFFGRLVDRKGARHLLNAVKHLEEQVDLADVEVVIAGDGPLRAELEAQARGLRTPVKFLGFVDEDDKASLLRSADLVVFPSTGGESFGIVLVEALASGAQVVLAGDNPGYRSTFENNEELLVDPADVNEFARRIHMGLFDEDFRRRAARFGEDHVKKFDLDVVMGRILRVYEGSR